MPRIRDNSLRESASRAIKPGVRHKLLENYFNSRRWVPTDEWYNMEGPTNILNIPSSWLPYSKKGINKRGGVRRRGWNKNWGERYKRCERNTFWEEGSHLRISKRGLSCLLAFMARLKLRSFSIEGKTITPLVTPPVTSLDLPL